MSYHQDWLMRQIEAISVTLAYLVTGKRPRQLSSQEQQTVSATNTLYRRLHQLVRKGQICEAENLLYEAMDESDPEAAEAAVLFYSELNRLSDSALEAGSFSRQEILDGLKYVSRRCGFDVF